MEPAEQLIINDSCYMNIVIETPSTLSRKNPSFLDHFF